MNFERNTISRFLSRLNSRGSWFGLFIFYTGFIYYLAMKPIEAGGALVRIPGWDKILHCGEFIIYFLLGWKAVSYLDLEEFDRYLLLTVLSLVFGGILEISQMAVIYRSASPLDWLADAVGIAIGYTVAKGIGRMGRELSDT